MLQIIMIIKNLFTGMIDDWRDKWNSENLPFYFVQIAPFPT